MRQCAADLSATDKGYFFACHGKPPLVNCTFQLPFL